MHEVRWPPIFDQWRHDLRLAFQGLRRARGFTSAAVLTLAVGIGSTTAMFALVQGVLLRPLPVPQQDRLLVAWKALPVAGSAHWPFRAPEIAVLRDESHVLESVAGISYYDPSPFAALENGVASSITGAAVTGDFFRMLGVEPILGRALRRADDVVGAENVLVITHGLWQRRYGGSRDVIGRRVIVSERPFTIVGVMPPQVECPHGVEAWMTVAASASTVTNPAFREGVLRDVDLIARLRPAATIEQARSELQGLTSRLEADAPPDAVRGVPVVRSYEDVVVGATRPALFVLFGAVGLVLLIASANVANLLLLRGEARRPELAVRAALGAGPGRLARQLLAESLLLALAAGVVGLAVTWWTLHALLALVPDGLPRVDSVRVDAGVLLFTVAVAFLAAALAGLAPALSVARADLAAHLRTGGRGATGRAARQGRRGLVVAQVALAVTVVAAAGLLTRSLLRLQAVDMGLAADRLVLVRLALPQAKYADGARHLQLLKELVTQLEAAPGIAGATPVHTPPFAGTGGWDAPEFTAEGQSAERAATNPSLNLESIHPNYFETFEVTLVRGRGFTEADRRGAPEVAVVSEELAERTWPGEDPIGKRIKLGRLDSTDAWRTVVGVARPTRYRELARLRATLYLPAEQFIVAAEILMLRTASPVALVARQARERVRAVDPGVQVTLVVPFTELLQGPLARPRFNALLIGAFGVAALLLAAIGLYAVMAASVRRRYTEIGVRMALGATAADVRGLVLGEGLRLAGLGAAIGLASALLATRLLRGLLFGVHPLDPASMLAAALLLVGVSALASYLPARRATRVDPVAMLRAE
jgi:predicted permease